MKLEFEIIGPVFDLFVQIKVGLFLLGIDSGSFCFLQVIQILRGLELIRLVHFQLFIP